MYCKRCGKQIADDSVFCKYCGTSTQAPQTGVGNNVTATKVSTNSKVIVECVPHWINALGYIIVVIILLMLGLGVSGIFLLLAAMAAVAIYFVMRSSRLSLTSEAVVGQIGIINTRKMVSPIHNVQDVYVSNGIAGKMLGYATITVSTAGSSKSEYIFKCVTNYDKFQREFVRLSNGYK